MSDNGRQYIRRVNLKKVIRKLIQKGSTPYFLFNINKSSNFDAGCSAQSEDNFTAEPNLPHYHRKHTVLVWQSKRAPFTDPKFCTRGFLADNLRNGHCVRQI